MADAAKQVTAKASTTQNTGFFSFFKRPDKKTAGEDVKLASNENNVSKLNTDELLLILKLA